MCFEKLVKLLSYVKQNVQYYQDINIKNMNCENYLYEMSKMPIVEKINIRNSYSDFVSKELKNISYLFNDELSLISSENISYYNKLININNQNFVIESTTGTSGVQLILIKSITERIRLGKALSKIRNTIVNGSATVKICSFMNHDNTLDNIPIATHKKQVINVEEEIKYLDNNQMFSWWYINIYRIEMYMKYLLENEIEFNSERTLKVIETNGSFVSRERRKYIEDVFSCSVYDHYGCKEVWAISYTCKFGHHHIIDENIILELIDEQGHQIFDNNVVGNIVLTSLNQFYMPFIRYRMDDSAYYMDGVCPCGLHSKRIVLVPKRNFIKGTSLSGDEEFKQIIKELTVNRKVVNFKSIAVIQDSFDSFVFYIIGNKENVYYLENTIKEISRKQLQKDYKIIFEYSEYVTHKGIFTCLC